jgi:hypothetical protein
MGIGNYFSEGKTEEASTAEVKNGGLTLPLTIRIHGVVLN